ncbi:MAG: phosphatidylglycerophosphatase A, partial [Calditrichaeota bacterium]|nr:phosphatidylglycerophosphatase A [Calditrichota bacterium]
WFVPPEPLLYLIAFGLFRLFDVSKLYPVNRLQDLPGGWGIMLDDIGAGIYTLLIMQIIIYFW